MRRIMSLLLVCALVICTPAAENGLLKGIFPKISLKAEAAVGQIPDNLALDGSTVPDATLLEYLKGELAKAGVTGNPTVKNLAQEITWDLTIPSGVTNLQGLGYARKATGFDMSGCNQVTSIADNEFNECEMTKVTLPSSVTRIGNSAFKACSKLTTINLNSVDWIGETAFAGCAVLNDSSIATMKHTLQYLGNGAFQGCLAITQASVPEITDTTLAYKVPKQLFQNCQKLVKVTFYDQGVQDILDSAFEGTGNLKFNVGNASGTWGSTLPAGVYTLGASAFSGSKIAALDMSGTQITEIKNDTFYNADLSESLVLPSGLKKIGQSAFANSGVTSVDMPNTVETLEKQCFQYTKKLENLVLSLNIKVIPESAFQGAGEPNLVAGGGSNYNNDQGQGEASTKLDVSFHDGTAAQSQLEEIQATAFNTATVYDDTFLKGLTKLHTIGKGAFSYTDFKELTIPACVTTVGESAFNGMYLLQKVTFADGSQVRELPDMLFGSDKVLSTSSTMGYSDFLLSSVQLPDKLQSIGKYAFGNCFSLETVGYKGKMVSGELNFPDTLLTVDEYAFANCASFSTEGSQTYFKILPIPNCGITKVTLPNSVTTIGKGAFKNCTMLQELKIGTGVKEIPEEMCMGCGAYPSKLREKDYLHTEDGTVATSSPEMTEADYQPIGFVGLKKITLSDNVESIGKNAFYQCYALSSFYKADGSSTSDLPTNLSQIGDAAFFQCKSLTEITFPTALKTIGNSAFAEAAQTIDERYQPQSNVYTIYHQYYGLKRADFQFATQLESVGKDAFAKTNLSSVSFPDSLQVISDGVCNGCYNLTTVNMSEKVTSVGENAFKDCYKLSTITLPFSAEWKSTIFAGAAANMNKKLTIPNGSSDNIDVIVGRENQMNLNCFKNFKDTTLTLTDSEKDVNDEQNNLLKYDSNDYISAVLSADGNQIQLTGKKVGTTAVKVTGKIDLFNQNLNYSNLTISISHEYNVNVTRLPITKLELSSKDLVDDNGQRVIYMSYGSTATKDVAAAFEPADTTDTLVWSVDDSSVAEVSDATVKDGVSTVKLQATGVGQAVLKVASPTMEETCLIRVRVPAQSVKMSESSLNLATGADYTLATTITYSKDYEEEAKNYPDLYTYSSSDESIVTVDPNTGALRAVADGTATITVKCLVSGKTATCKVTVKTGYKPPVKTITMSEEEAKMNVGDQKTLSATILPADADQTITWSSSDDKTATVANGTVTALKPGTVTITATADGNKKATCKITIKAPAKGMKIRATNGSTSKIFVKKGTTLTLSKFYTNSNCTDTFKFSAKKSKVGSVTESGTVSTKKPGKLVVYLTAYNDGVKSARTKITINVVKKAKKAKKIKIKGAKNVLVENRICLSAASTPSKATSTISWSSSNTAIATVDQYGVVTGVKAGKVKITASSDNGKKKSITVKVK